MSREGKRNSKDNYLRKGLFPDPLRVTCTSTLESWSFALPTVLSSSSNSLLDSIVWEEEAWEEVCVGGIVLEVMCSYGAGDLANTLTRVATIWQI